MESAPTLSKDEILRAVSAQRRATLSLLRPLQPEQFDLPTALPGWRIREVAAHLLSLDITGVTGQILPIAMSSMQRLERWNDRQVEKRARRSVPDLLVSLERWGRRFVRVARAIPAALYRTRVRTLWGRGPAALLIWSRAYDEWIHRQDIRRALRLPDEVVDLAQVAEFALNAMVVNTLPQLRGRSGQVAISLEGTPIARWVFDLDAATAGPEEDRADAQIVVPAPAFVMAASGRDAFEDLLRAGTLRIGGNDGLGREFLSRTRIV